MAESTYDVIIVGGGIGGTVLALSLGLQKRRVLVLEKDLKSIPNQRPEILAKATLQAFDRLGVGKRILSKALKFAILPRVLFLN
jgi:2-polyprenyl-6-methoxyphenol hydroxylase-like FAD-dependent oxidoreductase